MADSALGDLVGAEHRALPRPRVTCLLLPRVVVVSDRRVGRADLADAVLVVARDVSGEGTGERQQLLVWHDVVDEAEAEGLLGVQEVAREAHLPGPAHADRLRQEDRQTPPRHHSHPRVGVAELGPFGRDEEVAVEGQLESAGDGDAIDGADDRLGQPRERTSRPM